MATSTVETTAIVVQLPPEVLGPASPYDQRRLALKSDADVILKEARSITAVDSPEVAERAVTAGRLLQSQQKETEIFFTPIKRQIDAFKKPVLEAEKEMTDAIEKEKRRLGILLTGWNQECERKRQEEERKAREEAERIAREEQLARAVELEQSGDVSAAEAVLEEPVFAPVVHQTIAPPKVAGQVAKVTYGAAVENFLALVKAVAEGKAPIQCLKADEQYLNGKARLDKENFSVPGVKLVKTTGTHFRG